MIKWVPVLRSNVTTFSSFSAIFKTRSICDSQSLQHTLSAKWIKMTKIEGLPWTEDHTSPHLLFTLFRWWGGRLRGAQVCSLSDLFPLPLLLSQTSENICTKQPFFFLAFRSHFDKQSKGSEVEGRRGQMDGRTWKDRYKSYSAYSSMITVAWNLRRFFCNFFSPWCRDDDRPERARNSESL